MKFYTRLIQLPSDPYLHYMVHASHTRCGISLKMGKQKVLYYYQDEHQICPLCKTKNIPQFRPWNRLKIIKDGEFAERLLGRLHVLFSIIPQNQRVSLGIHLCTIVGTSLPNWLENPSAKVEERLEKENKLRISYQVKDGRENRLISYEQISISYEEVLVSLLAILQNKRN